MQMVMTPDETQIQILVNWPMSHAKRVTRDNWKNPEYRVIAAISKLRTDKLSRRQAAFSFAVLCIIMFCPSESLQSISAHAVNRSPGLFLVLKYLICTQEHFNTLASYLECSWYVSTLCCIQFVLLKNIQGI